MENPYTKTRTTSQEGPEFFKCKQNTWEFGKKSSIVEIRRFCKTWPTHWVIEVKLMKFHLKIWITCRIRSKQTSGRLFAWPCCQRLLKRLNRELLRQDYIRIQLNSTYKLEWAALFAWTVLPKNSALVWLCLYSIWLSSTKSAFWSTQRGVHSPSAIIRILICLRSIDTVYTLVVGTVVSILVLLSSPCMNRMTFCIQASW